MKDMQENIVHDIQVTDNYVKPPLSAAYIGMNLTELRADTIISYDRDGQPIYLNDSEWDFPTLALTPIDKTSFNFTTVESAAKFNKNNILTSQIILATEIFSLSRRGEALRITSIRNTFKAILRLVKIADKRNMTIHELISTENHPKDFVKEIPIEICGNLSKLISSYLMLTNNALSLRPHKDFFKELQKRHREREKNGKQTPVIPSRILHARYHHYNDIILDFTDSAEKLQALAEELSSDPYYGRDISKASRPSKANHGFEKLCPKPNFAKATVDHELVAYCAKNNIKSAANFSSHIGLVQHCAKSLVHIYTLVRDHEAKLLENNCVQPAQGWSSKGLYMMGVSTKLTGTAKDTAWIANELIVEPIAALKTIKSMISPYLPKKFVDGDYLLITPSHLPFCGAKPGKTVIRADTTRYEKYLPPILIEEDDILQLEAIDPLADWRSDPKYKVGKPWKIATHQFRRTMAVFGAQSQILDIPELKRLLTHLTEAMSVYYQRGCSAGGYNMKLKSPELAKEIKQALQDTKWISYLNEVLYSTEKLHGGHGDRITPSIKNDDINRIIFRQTAEETRSKVKKGLLSWQPTPMGGCTSNKPCDDRAHGNFASCFGCASSVLKASRVESVIEHAKADLMILDPKSFEYRMETRNIKDYEFILSNLK
jgi:hypothetical protein